MREKVHIKTVNFGCDECGKRSGHHHEQDSDCFNGEFPFLYESGWIYIHHLKLKVALDQAIQASDRHLCSNHCLIKFIKRLIEKKKKIGGKNENNKSISDSTFQ